MEVGALYIVDVPADEFYDINDAFIRMYWDAYDIGTSLDGDVCLHNGEVICVLEMTEVPKSTTDLCVFRVLSRHGACERITTKFNMRRWLKEL